MGTSSEAPFAHPVERELARVLDEHGIRWLYEPHTFVLERGPDGSVREAFTPDFFLPKLGRYLECTVMRQVYGSGARPSRPGRREGLPWRSCSGGDFERPARR